MKKTSHAMVSFAVALIALVIAVQIAWVFVKPLIPVLAIIFLIVVAWIVISRLRNYHEAKQHNSLFRGQ